MLDETQRDVAMAWARAMMGAAVGAAAWRPPDAMVLGVPLMQSAVALPRPLHHLEHRQPVVCSLILILIGMMTYDLVRNMWSWDGSTGQQRLMDTILSWSRSRVAKQLSYSSRSA